MAGPGLVIGLGPPQLLAEALEPGAAIAAPILDARGLERGRLGPRRDEVARAPTDRLRGTLVPLRVGEALGGLVALLPDGTRPDPAREVGQQGRQALGHVAKGLDRRAADVAVAFAENDRHAVHERFALPARGAIELAALENEPRQVFAVHLPPHDEAVRLRARGEQLTRRSRDLRQGVVARAHKRLPVVTGPASRAFGSAS